MRFKAMFTEQILAFFPHDFKVGTISHDLSEPELNVT